MAYTMNTPKKCEIVLVVYKRMMFLFFLLEFASKVVMNIG